jgi:malonyl-CoA O-methyltransferase
MTDSSIITIDKKRAQMRFNNAAATYDNHADLQRYVVDNLVENLDAIRISPNSILDLGAGTGYCARELTARYPKTPITLLDVSPEMLKHARNNAPRWFSRERYVCADAESIPIANASVDFIFSSLTLQWCNRLDDVFKECHRVLKPNGLLLFSSLGPDTLHEFREAWETVHPRPRFNQFIDMHDVGDALIRAGFAGPVLACDNMTINYPDVHSIVRDLRALGATNSLNSRSRGLLTPRVFNRVVDHYDKRRQDGKLPATFEVIYAHAWRPDRDTRPQDGTTVATFPFTEIGRRK